MTFRIRGVNSITGGTQPLFVIDGVPMPTQQITNEDTETVNNPLLGLNPNDIESMEILKDAAAAAIYGAKGANGVIIVTSRTGKTGKPRMNVSLSYGLDFPTKIPNHISSAQTASLLNVALKNA